MQNVIIPTEAPLAEALEAKLHSDIPLTKHMGIRVSSYSERGLTLAVPFEPNVNHVCAVFGGSLAAAVTLAGWGFLWLYLSENNCPAHILIQESHISYLHPVTEDFQARCTTPPPKGLQTLQRMMERKGKGRIKLSCEVIQRGIPCVAFTGTYVILRNFI